MRPGKHSIAIVPAFLWAALFAVACGSGSQQGEDATRALVLDPAACSAARDLLRAGPNRSFASSFESVGDFSGFYIVPQDYHNSCSHDLSTEKVRTGTYAHKGWIYDSYLPSTPLVNNNHRGYPTIQLQKTAGGPFVTPCLITLWVWLDVTLHAATPENEWFSLATIADDTSDEWKDVVCVNVSYEGFVHLMHVPATGKAEYLYQTNTVTFPMRQWVKIEIYVDFDSANGYLKVRQDGALVSHARVYCRKKRLAQLHFGLYAPPSLSSSAVYNDDLLIQEVDTDPWP
jgi:hypothetical protein